MIRIVEGRASRWLRRPSRSSDSPSEYLLADESALSPTRDGQHTTLAVPCPLLSVNAVTLFDGVYLPGTVLEPLWIHLRDDAVEDSRIGSPLESGN
jgi:hypothetical protein